jgi:hypothetical protein
MNDATLDESYGIDPDIKNCLLCVRFFMADDSVDQQAMKLIVGPVLHVEIIIIDRDRPTMCTVSFAAFVGSTLSMYVTPKASLMDLSVENIAFAISQRVATRLGDYYLKMHTDNIPYNWYDSRFLMPFLNPYILDIVNDVHSDPTQVFCSQMVVLGMRQCMHTAENGPLIGELHLLNSRLTSPRTLLNLLRKFGRLMESTELTEIVGRGFEASRSNTFNV